MVNLRKWSQTATGNASVAGGANTINFAEGQTPGSVNNSAREMMAQVRKVYVPSEWGWVEHSATASVASQTTFKIAGDNTSDYTAGRRWRLKSGSTTRYGTIVSSSYTVETTVTVQVDGGVSLSASHSLAAVSPIDASSNQLPLASQSFLRNRIINGDMRIDQRNAGASVTPTTDQYTLDRWNVTITVGSKFSVQQQTSVVPTGFTHALKVTSLSAYSVAAGDYLIINQPIEGLNFSDLSWGTANAQSVTLSFWVYSSLTGTFGGAMSNSGATRSYPFTYSIGSANTWTKISVTIPGDTTGTWLTNTSAGAYVIFSLGSGSTYSGTANAWVGSNIRSVTGAVSVVGTNAATWYITGVQLEAGSVATPFERRQYGQELALCQRYYCKTFSQSVAPADNNGFYEGALSAYANTTNVSPTCTWGFPVEMRIAPTVTLYNPRATGTAGQWSEASSGTLANARSFYISTRNATIDNNATVATVAQVWSIHAAATAEL